MWFSFKNQRKEEFDISFIKSLWSSKDIDWDFVESQGTLDGILTLWDMSILMVVETLKGDNSLSVKCATLCKRLAGLQMFMVQMITRREILFGPSSFPCQIIVMGHGV